MTKPKIGPLFSTPKKKRTFFIASAALLILCISIGAIIYNNSKDNTVKPTAKANTEKTALTTESNSTSSATNTTPQAPSVVTNTTTENKPAAPTNNTPAVTNTPSQNPTTTQPPSNSNPITPPTINNLSGNSANQGLAAYDDNFIYYSNGKDNCKLYKANKDGSNPIKLSDTSAICISLSGNWAYYLSDDGIYKVNSNGGTPSKISSSKPLFMQVSGDWLYFVDGSYVNFITKLKIDGSDTQKIKLSEGLSISADGPLCISGDWIYCKIFSPTDKCTGLWRVKKDGSSINKISLASSYYFAVDGDWIYYFNGSNSNIEKIKGDGSSCTPLYKPNSGIYSINVYNGYIYYSVDYQCGTADQLGIYRMSLNGSNITKLLSGNARRICLAHGMLFYDNTEGRHQVKIN